MGYALLAHTLGKMRPCAIGEHSNTEIHTIVLKKYNYTGEIIFGRKYIPHSQSPITFLFVYTTHTVTRRKTFAKGGVTQTVLKRRSCEIVH